MSHVCAPEFQRLFCLQFVAGNHGSNSSHHTAVNHAEAIGDSQTIHAKTNYNTKARGQTKCNAEASGQTLCQTVCGPV
ncbi:MAG: hypothetical protein IJ206_04410 [Oscillospiraceae bacterium]|nr:hypothetical protein [Oscillospiraceae bacterium]